MAKKQTKRKRPLIGPPTFAPDMGRIRPAAKPRSSGELYRVIGDRTGLKARDVRSVFEALSQVMAADLVKGSGEAKVGNLMKVKLIREPAVPAREARNPFTGEMQLFKAKPARSVLKVRPLKSMKGMIEPE